MDRVLQALTDAGCRTRGNGNGQHTAQCPAHEDRNPSLSVREQDGKVLLNCHVGCSTDQILEALALTMGDLFDRPAENGDQTLRRHIAATYDYTDADGEVLFQKIRYFPKDFRVRRPDGRGDWAWGIGDADRVLYRLPDVRDAIRTGRTIYVVEGEKSADRLADAGIVASCNFDGAAKEGHRAKWRPAYGDALRGAHAVVVVDNDEPGYAHGRAIVADLTGKAASVRVVRGLVTRKGADLDDHLDAGHSLDELVEVDLAERDAPTEELPAAAPDEDPVDQADVQARIHESEIQRELSKLRVRDAARRAFRAEQAGTPAPPRPILLSELLAEPDQATRYRIEGLLPAEGRAMLAAQFKAGKTTFTGNLTRVLVDGGLFLDQYGSDPATGRVVVLDTEMSQDTLKAWLRDQRIKHPDRVVVVALRGKVGSFDLLDPVIHQEWVVALRALAAEVVILDCLRPVLDALGLDENTDSGRLLVALDALVDQAGARELIVVHHMGHTSERSRGSSRLRDWPDVEWRLVREDPDDPSSRRFFSAYGRDVEVPETALDYEPLTRHLTIAGGNRKDAAAIRLIPDVLDILSDQPGLSGRAIESILSEVGVPQKMGREAVRRAIDDGYVHALPGHRGARNHHLTNKGKAVASASKDPSDRVSAGDALAPKDQHGDDRPKGTKNGKAAGHSASASVRRSSSAFPQHGDSECVSASIEDALTRTDAVTHSASHTDDELDSWVLTSVTRDPRPVGAISADVGTCLGATPVDPWRIQSALERLETRGEVVRHPSNGNGPPMWSLPPRTTAA